MPVQETFFSQKVGDRKVEVIKTYDLSFAREAFDDMDDAGLKHLWATLEPEKLYDAEDLPVLDAPDGEAEAFLWDEMCEQAREDVRQDPNLRSFFVVTEFDGKQMNNLYVSPDWPSAESYAKNFIERGKR